MGSAVLRHSPVGCPHISSHGREATRSVPAKAKESFDLFILTLRSTVLLFKIISTFFLFLQLLSLDL